MPEVSRPRPAPPVPVPWRIALAARDLVARAFGIHIVRRNSYSLVRRDYYSPLPELDEIPVEYWERPSALLGISLDPSAQLRWAERELAALVQEFAPPLHSASSPGEYYAHNGAYDSVDGEIAYAIVRRLRPSRLIELGSGMSTRALAAACRRNAAEGDPTRYVVVDPYPRGLVPEDLPGVTEQRRLRAQDLPLEELASLTAGDVLFVDTSHTVKPGGEVVFLVLEVLPVLQPGVLVHFHDVFLPWHYHREWVEHGWIWAEQYLLQAFLAFNDEWEILWASHAVSRTDPSGLEALVPSYRVRSRPSAFWIRRREECRA